ncbi:hypothetical protein ACU6TU_13160 [Halomonas sp. LS-001]
MEIKEVRKVTGRVTPEKVKGWFWRTLSFLVSSIYFSNLPVILFLVYMHENGFFSYDFYERGVFGMKAFFGLLVLMILITSFMLYAFVFPFIKWKVKNKLEVVNLVGMSILSGVMWLFFGLMVYFSEWLDWELFVYVGLVCLLLVIHIAMILYAVPKLQFVSLAVIATLSLVLTFHFREAAANLVGSALHGFGSGGGVCVKITDTEERYHIAGRLILASPEYVYIQRANNTSVTAVKVDSRTLYSVGADECEEKVVEDETANLDIEPTS